MSLRLEESTDCEEWELDAEYITIPPPAFIERSRVNDLLDQPHQTRFCQAVCNALHSKAAEITFAQLVDGLPLEKVADFTGGVLFHETVLQHEKLCPGALERARTFRDNFDPASLDLPVEVLERYQGIPAGSRASKLPLVELVAVAIHRIAVLLYQQGSMHKEIGLPVEENRLCFRGLNETYRHYYPTPFCLHEFADPERHPDGVADITGYWAENWIFGGVVVFSRGESGLECKDVWLHSFRKNTTDRVWALSGDQLAKLLSFLESEQQDPSNCPLPILLEKTNQRRINADNCIPEHNIFRDRWERKMRFATRSTWELAQHCVDDDWIYPLSDDEVPF